MWSDELHDQPPVLDALDRDVLRPDTEALAQVTFDGDLPAFAYRSACCIPHGQSMDCVERACKALVLRRALDLRPTGARPRAATPVRMVYGAGDGPPTPTTLEFRAGFGLNSTLVPVLEEIPIRLRFG